MSAEHSANERRQHPRIVHNIPLKLSCEQGDVVTETKNLSCSGAYCQVEHFIEPMTKLEIQLLLPIKKNNTKTTKKVKCCGVVVRAQRSPDETFDTAIFFNEITAKDRRVLEQFVDGLLEEGQEAAV